MFSSEELQKKGEKVIQSALKQNVNQAKSGRWSLERANLVRQSGTKVFKRTTKM